MIDVQAGDISGREMLITYQSGEHFNGSSWGNRIKDQTNKQFIYFKEKVNQLTPDLRFMRLIHAYFGQLMLMNSSWWLDLG